MPKTPLSASGGHLPKEAHPVHDVTEISAGLPPSNQERGEAALRSFNAFPELHQTMMDHDMDKTAAVSNAVPRRK